MTLYLHAPWGPPVALQPPLPCSSAEAALPAGSHPATVSIGLILLPARYQLTAFIPSTASVVDALRRVENEFAKINKLLGYQVATNKSDEDLEFNPKLYGPEVDINNIDPDIPVKREIFAERICPKFFKAKTRWETLHRAMLDAQDWHMFLKDCYHEADAEAFKDAAELFGSNQMIEEKTVHLKDFINPRICIEFLEGGFLHSILIHEGTLKIFNQLPSKTVMGDFIHWLSKNNVSRHRWVASESYRHLRCSNHQSG